MKIGQVRPANRSEWVKNRSCLPGEIGQNRSELVKTGSKSGQIARNVPRTTKIPREGRLEIAVIFLTKQGSMVGRLSLTHVRERKLAVPPNFDYSDMNGRESLLASDRRSQRDHAPWRLNLTRKSRSNLPLEIIT